MVAAITRPATSITRVGASAITACAAANTASPPGNNTRGLRCISVTATGSVVTATQVA